MAKRKHDQAWYKEEKEVVVDLIKLGYRARRQPGSGNRAVDLQHDCVWHDSPIGRLHIECKFKGKATWKTCENDRAGADILTMRESHGKRMVYMDWTTFLQLVGSAADRSETAADLPSVEPKPWLTETEQGFVAMQRTAAQRARIQSAHQNPPQRKPKPNKLKGRGFGK